MDNELKSLAKIIIDAMRYYDLNVDKLSRLTGISERFLDALLEDKFNQLPSAPYVHGYLNKVAKVLNLDGEEIWRIYLKDHRAIRRSGEKDKFPPNRFIYRFWFNRPVVLAAILIIILLLYLFLRINLVGRPRLYFEQWLNQNYLTASSSKIQIDGRLKPLAVLTINGEQINLDTDGRFEAAIRLNPGLNILNFKVRKFLGKEKLVAVKQIFYEPAAETPNFSENNLNGLNVHE